MTGRRGDEGFSVAPRRLGDEPARRRQRAVRVGIVIVVILAIVGIGWLGPRIDQRPNFDIAFFATPTPRGTPTPTPSRLTPTPRTPTALPEITRPSGSPAIGRVAFVTDALHVLDLAGGKNYTGIRAIPGSDAVFAAPSGDGWLCVCYADRAFGGGQETVIQLVRTDAEGQEIQTTILARIPPGHDPNLEFPGVTIDVDVDSGGHRALLGIAKRDHDVWQISAGVIDLDKGALGPLVELGRTRVEPPSSGASPSPGSDPSAAPAATPSDGGGLPYLPDLYLDGPNVRISPDGRTAFVWGVEYASSVSEGPLAATASAWRVTIDEAGALTAAGRAPGLESLPPFCGAVAFAADDRLAWLCQNVSLDGSTEATYQVGTVGLDGKAAGTIEQTAFDAHYFEYGSPVVDRANGLIYSWDPNGLTITRQDVHALTTERMTFDAASEASSGGPPGGGAKPADWHDTGSSIARYGASMLGGAPDGSRIYAVAIGDSSGSGRSSGGSLGILVIDRATLGLVDRWAPAASYLSLAVTASGQVAAAGLPGVDDQGREAPWQASLTIHDPTDGRILVRFGQLGPDLPPFLIGR